MAERSGVFVLQNDNSLISMERKQFAKEDDFQRLLTNFPALLVGDQIDPENPRRWVLVKREQVIATDDIGATQWSIDHLFLDQDGIPTLVEIKRQNDYRIRREVVGQMLDYAANCATYWTIDMLQSNFEKTCEAAQPPRPSEAVLTELIGPEQTAAEFWGRVKINLQAGKIRMLFVSDAIPLELRRIVEFLNRQMDPAEVLAVELRQFEGQGLKTLVPMVFGQTQEAVKKRDGGAAGQHWDQESLFEKLRQKVGPKEVEIAQKIFDWMQMGGRTLRFGTGRENGSVYPVFRPGGVYINPVYLSTDGKLWLQFAALDRKPVFGDLDKRRMLMTRFGAIKDTGFVEADLTRYRSIALSKIAADPDGLSKVLSTLEWMDEQIAHHFSS
jgi:hypothetical protein